MCVNARKVLCAIMLMEVVNVSVAGWEIIVMYLAAKAIGDKIALIYVSVKMEPDVQDLTARASALMAGLEHFATKVALKESLVLTASTCVSV